MAFNAPDSDSTSWYCNVDRTMALLLIALGILLTAFVYVLVYVFTVEIPAHKQYIIDCRNQGGVVLTNVDSTVCVDKKAIKQI